MRELINSYSKQMLGWIPRIIQHRTKDSGMEVDRDQKGNGIGLFEPSSCYAQYISFQNYVL